MTARAIPAYLLAATLLTLLGAAFAPPAGAEKAGQVTLFDAEQTEGGPGLEWMAAGINGDIWYTAGGPIRRMSSLGKISIADSSLRVMMGGSGITSPIAAAPEGGVWTRASLGAEASFDWLGRIGPDASADLFQPTLPADINLGEEMTSSPDGSLWFTVKTNQGSPESLGRVTRSRELTLFPEVTGSGGTYGNKTGGRANPALRITTGPDGNIWFTKREPSAESGGIGRVAPSGEVTDFSAQVPKGYWPGEITAGPDGAVWFGCATESPRGEKPTDPQVGRMTTAGEVKLFPVETCPADMAPGPDGNVWYVASYKPGEMAARIGRITPSGEVTEFTIDRTRILSDGTRMTNMPTAIVPGPDGAMWFNFPETSQLARIATGVESSSADQVVMVPARASRAQVARGLQLPARCVESCVVNASMVAGGKVVARKRVALRKPGTRRISLKARLRSSTRSVSVRFKSDTWSKVGVVPVGR